MALTADIPPTLHPLRDPDSFARAFAAHAPAMTDAAQAVLRDRGQAQDVVQDVFLRLWRKPESYDPARGELGPYLRLMTRSRALDLWRQGATARRATERMERMEQTSLRDSGRQRDEPAHIAERADDRRELVNALRALSPPQRQAVVLTYWGGLTAEEVAHRSQVPVGTAKSRIRLGLQRLRVTESLSAA